MADGDFAEESGEGYTFTPGSPVARGTHTFRTQSANDFGHKSKVAKDVLTVQ